MERNRQEIGDCFLMKGVTIKEPMTLYHVTDINGDKLQALSISAIFFVILPRIKQYLLLQIGERTLSYIEAIIAMK